MRSRLLKLDLHTHIYEATGCKAPTIELVMAVISLAKRAGLDGMAITEHNNPDYGFLFAELSREVLDDDPFVIIPGQERDDFNNNRQVVELYLQERLIFRFLAHPGNPDGNLQGDMSDLHGIEIRNSVHDWHIPTDEVRRVAKEHGLLLLGVSDAHYLSQIGKHYTMTTLEDLYRRVAVGEKVHP